MTDSNVFKVSYYKIGKPTGTRRFTSFNTSYEEVLFGHLIKNLCISNYYIDYSYDFQNENLFIKRESCNAFLCVYKLYFYDLQDRTKQLCTYQVEIECVHNSNAHDLFDELFREDYYGLPVAKTKVEKDTSAFSIPSKVFFFLMVAAPGIKLKKYAQVKSSMAKSTYYRHKKYCIEHGFLVEGKLTKEFRDWRKLKYG